jgi:ABC-type transport system involved in cytochrome bd biosynthesis fused ATPase/permease subunit
MRQNRQQRAFVLVAAIAIACALLLLLVAMFAPHSPTGNAADFVAILPLLLVGIISPLSLLSPLAFAYAGRVPQAPELAPSFQRPPPFRRG